MKKTITTNGKKGGNLVGKPHNDESGKPVGGIKAIVTDANNKPVELEGGEVIINKEASKKHWRELSRINQSAGNGVPIGPPIDPHDEDPIEYKDGGNIIDFNPNHIPNRWIIKYAQKIREKHPDIWKLGGNIFGNEAFSNLLRVSNRGYWLDSEAWMYIKWRSYVARHRGDFRTAGVVAMMKWGDKVDKGWAYMKDLIEEEIQKKPSKSGWKTKKTARVEKAPTKKLKDGGNIIDELSPTMNNLIVDNLKKGDGIDIEYNGNKISIKVKSRNKVKNDTVDRIIFDNMSNPNRVKYYAYKKADGVWRFAKGDMAIDVKTIELSNSTEEDETSKLKAERLAIIEERKQQRTERKAEKATTKEENKTKRIEARQVRIQKRASEESAKTDVDYFKLFSEYLTTTSYSKDIISHDEFIGGIVYSYTEMISNPSGYSISEKYAIIKEMMGLLASPYGKELLKLHPLLKQDNYLIENNFEKIQTEYFYYLLDHNDELNILNEKYLEYNKFKAILGDNNLESIAKVNEELTSIKSKIQSETSYNPLAYFNLYFLLNGATQKQLNDKPIIENPFKLKAFNDWFLNSKVVDSSGKPLLVYHGTGADDFSRFSFDVFPGAYFGENKSYSDWFQKARGTEGTMFECYLRIQNPIDLRIFKTKKVKYSDVVAYIALRYGYTLPENTMLKTASDAEGGLWIWQYIRGGVDWLKTIKNDKQFDGFAFYENNPSDIDRSGNENITPAWLVFEPTQIKSANGNITFIYDSKDMRFEKGGKL